MAYDIGPRISITGEKEFNNQIRQINNSIKEYSSELQALGKEMDANGKSHDNLQKKAELLKKEYDEQKKKSEVLHQQFKKEADKLSDLAEAYEKTKKECGETSKEADKAKTAFNKQEETVSKLKTAINNTDGYINTLTGSMKTNEAELQSISKETLKLEANQQKLNSQIKKADAEINEYEAELKSLTAEMDANGKSQDGLQKKAENLEKQYDTQKEKSSALQQEYNREVQELKDLAGAYQNTKEECGENSLETAKAETAFNEQAEAVSKLKTKINDTETSINTLTSEIKKNQTEIEKMGNKYQQAADKLQTVSDKTKTFGDNMTAAGKKLTPVSVATTGIGTAVGVMAMDFETAFTGVKKTVEGTPEQLDAIRQGILDLAKETSSSATDIAAVSEAAGQLGVKTEDILEFTKTMVMLGDTTNLEATEAASALAKFANITQMSADEYDNLGSVIVELGNNFATTEADIVEMATRLAATGELAGFSEPQIMAISTALSSVGIEAEAGGSAFSKLTKQVQVAVETGSDKLNDFASIAGMTASDFQQAFEKDAVSAIGAFISGLNDTERNGMSAVAVLDDMGIKDVRLSNTILSLASSGDLLSNTIDTANTAWKDNTALQDEAQKKYETTSAKISQLKESFREVAVGLGEILLPVLQDLAEGLKGALESFNGMSNGGKKAVMVLGGILMGIAPLLSAIGQMSLGISSVTKILSKGLAQGGIITKMIGGIKTAVFGLFSLIMAHPVIAVITAVIAAVILLYTKCEWFRDAVNAVWTIMKEAFSNVWDGIISFFTETLPQAWSGVVEWVQGIPEWWNGIWESVKTAFSLAWEAIATNPIVQIIINTISELWENAKETLSGIWDGICGIAAGTWELLKNIILGPVLLLIDLVTGNFEKLKSDASNIWNNIKSAASTIWNGIGETISSLVSGMIEHVKTMFTGIKDFIAGIWNNIVDFTRTSWTKLKEAVLNIGKNLRDGAVNAFESMASGIKNAVSKIGSTVKNGFKTAIDYITSLPGRAIGWGKDFVQGLIDGIKSMMKGVSDAASGVANKIRSFLHFTRPDEGPLRDYETWMPHFIEGLTKGIEKNKKMITNAVESMTEQMNVTMTADGTGLMNMPDYTGMLSQKIENHFLVQVGNNEFDSYIVKTAEKGISKNQGNNRW